MIGGRSLTRPVSVAIRTLLVCGTENYLLSPVYNQLYRHPLCVQKQQFISDLDNSNDYRKHFLAREWQFFLCILSIQLKFFEIWSINLKNERKTELKTENFKNVYSNVQWNINFQSENAFNNENKEMLGMTHLGRGIWIYRTKSTILGSISSIICKSSSMPTVTLRLDRSVLLRPVSLSLVSILIFIAFGLSSSLCGIWTSWNAFSRLFNAISVGENISILDARSLQERFFYHKQYTWMKKKTQNNKHFKKYPFTLMNRWIIKLKQVNRKKTWIQVWYCIHTCNYSFTFFVLYFFFSLLFSDLWLRQKNICSLCSITVYLAKFQLSIDIKSPKNGGVNCRRPKYKNQKKFFFYISVWFCCDYCA